MELKASDLEKIFNGAGTVLTHDEKKEVPKCLPGSIYGDGGRFSSNIMKSDPGMPGHGSVTAPPLYSNIMTEANNREIVGFTLPKGDPIVRRINKVKDILTVRQYELINTKILTLTEDEAEMLIDVIRKLIDEGVYKE